MKNSLEEIVRRLLGSASLAEIDAFRSLGDKLADAGFVIVPRELTEAMLNAAGDATIWDNPGSLNVVEHAWSAAIEAWLAED